MIFHSPDLLRIATLWLTCRFTSAFLCTTLLQITTNRPKTLNMSIKPMTPIATQFSASAKSQGN
jgi:hypothetical protein